MGRLVRRYIRGYRIEARRDVRVGTWSSKLTQAVAGQVLVEAAVDAIALGGAVTGGYFGVNASVSFTGTPRALRARMAVATGITVTGSTYGFHLEQEILGTGVVTASWEGIRLEMYSEAGTTAPDMYGIFMSNYVAGTTGLLYFMRLQENVAAQMEAAFYIRVVDMDNLFYLFPTVTTAWAQTGNPANQNGWIKVDLAGTIRYIRLYSTAP